MALTNFKTFIFGTGLAFAASLALPQAAQAGSLTFKFDSRNGASVHYGHAPRYRHAPRHRYGAHSKRWRACGPRRALRKARRLGVRHAQLRRFNKRRTVVVGRYYGERVRVVFNRRCNVRNFVYR